MIGNVSIGTAVRRMTIGLTATLAILPCVAESDPRHRLAEEIRRGGREQAFPALEKAIDSNDIELVASGMLSDNWMVSQRAVSFVCTLRGRENLSVLRLAYSLISGAWSGSDDVGAAIIADRRSLLIAMHETVYPGITVPSDFEQSKIDQLLADAAHISDASNGTTVRPNVDDAIRSLRVEHSTQKDQRFGAGTQESYKNDGSHQSSFVRKEAVVALCIALVGLIGFWIILKQRR